MNKIKCIVLLLGLITGWHAYGQDVSLTTTVQDLRVCGDAAVFSINLKNLSGQPLGDVQISTLLPLGTELVENQSDYLLDGSSTAQNHIFNVGAVPTDSEVDIEFTAKAQCALIDYVDEFGVDGLANVKTEASYQIGSAQKKYEEPEGSASFNVLYPSLLIQMGEGDAERVAPVGQTINRIFTITNNGNTHVGNEGLTVSVTHIGSTKTLSITDGSGTFYPLTTNSNVSSIELKNFQEFGNQDDRLDPGESITLTEEVRVTRCGINQASDFAVKWGCNETVCNQNANNAIVRSLISELDGSPRMSTSLSYESVNYCGRAIPVTISVKNSALRINSEKDIANRGLVREISLNKQGSSYRLSDFKFISKQGDDIAVDPSQIYNQGNIILFDNSFFELYGSEVRGLEDIDLDGVYNEIMPENEFFLKASMYLSCEDGYSDFLINNGNSKVELRCTTYARSVCYDADNTYETISFIDNFISNNIDGPIDIVDGQAVLYSFEIDRQVTGDVKCDAGTFSSIIKLPSIAYQVDVNNVKWENSLVAAIQEADGTLRITGGGGKGKYTVPITLNCELDQALTASSNISWDMYYDCSGDGCCLRHIASDTYEVFNHCPGTVGECVRTTGLEATRTTLGYPENEEGFYSILPSSTVAPSDDIRLNAAMEGDEVNLLATGIVSSGVYNKLKVKIQYESPYDDEEVLKFTNGYFVIGSGEDTEKYPVLTPPAKSQNTIDGKVVHYLTFLVENYNKSFQTGLKVDLSANFRIEQISSTDFIAGEFRLNKLRATHSGINTDSNEISCESYGTNLSIVRSFFKQRNYPFPISLSSLCIGSSMSVSMEPYGVNSDPFPNEFRPTNTITKITAIIPEGYQYNEARSRISYRNINTNRNYTLYLDEPTIEVITDGSQRLTFSSTRDGDPLPTFEPNHINGNINVSVGLFPLCYDPTSEYKDALIETTQMNLSEEVYGDREYKFRSVRKKVNIDGATLKDGFEDAVSWNVTLSNYNINHSWITLEPPENVTITSVTETVSGTELDLISYDDERPEKKWVKIGTIRSSRSIIVNAKYNNCIQDVTDDIKITASYACGGFPESPFDETDCSISSEPVVDYLQIRYKNADLQANFNKVNETANLCEPIPFEVDLLSSGLGNMYDMHVLTNIPVGMTMVPGSGKYNRNGTWQPLGEAVNISHNGVSGTGWDISNTALGDEGFAGGEEMKVRFSLEAGCDQAPSSNFDPGIPVLLYVTGRTNCNDDIVLPFQEKVDINGFSLVDKELIPSIATEAICGSSSQSLLNVSVYNPLEVASVSQELLVQLSPTMRYEGIPLGSPNPISVISDEKGTLITWNIDGIGPKSTINKHEILVTITDPVASSVVMETRTRVYGSAICVSNQQSCPLTGTTGFNQRDITIEREGCEICPGATITTNVQCAGKLTGFEATFTEDISRSTITWDFGDGTTSQEGQPTHTYAEAGTYNVTLTVDGPFDCQTVVEDKVIIEACHNCEECIPSFSPLPGEKYVLSAWVKEGSVPGTRTYEQVAVTLDFRNTDETIILRPKGAIIDGWQRIEQAFVVPTAASAIAVNLTNESTGEAYFDDIRIHPFNANMKSFVYDPISMRLMAELDERNYATFYEYDEEGALIRVKKETERGIKTIQESRNHSIKINP